MSIEDKEAIKEELKTDIGRMHVKMSLQILIGIIGGTISICLTIFGGIWHIESEFEDYKNKTDKNTENIVEIKTDCHSLWSECGTLQGQINNQYQNANNNNTRSTK